MNEQIQQILSQLDSIHFSLLGLSVVLLILLGFSVSKKSHPANETSNDVAAQEKAADPGQDSTVEKEATPNVVKVTEYSEDAALQLLSLLQQEARFIDFLQEDVQHYSDADIGAAARVVHEGAKKVLDENFAIAPIRDENEDSAITLQPGFDNKAIRLSGNVVGEPPFTGQLLHRGWRITEVKLPKVIEGHDSKLIAPAEVEL